MIYLEIWKCGNVEIFGSDFRILTFPDFHIQ